MEHQRKLFQQRGYSEDLLPKTQSQRTWKTFNYFTLWWQLSSVPFSLPR